MTIDDQDSLKQSTLINDDQQFLMTIDDQHFFGLLADMSQKQPLHSFFQGRLESR